MTNEEHFQEIGKRCVRKFLQRELGVSERVANEVRIKHVFYPKAGVVTGTLYAEFWSVDELDIVKRYSKNLKSTDGFRPKIVQYIPQSLFDRYKAVEECAFKIRQKDNDQTTRIWVGEDFELRVRQRGSKTPWANIIPVKLLNLPAQAPRKPRTEIDLMDKRTPSTPRVGVITRNPSSSIFSYNVFNNIGETEA